jgi:hypothetical protein
MKVKTTYTKSRYFTAGKEYEILSVSGVSARVMDDDGDSVHIILPNDRGISCSYLGRAAGEHSWEIVNDEWVDVPDSEGYWWVKSDELGTTIVEVAKSSMSGELHYGQFGINDLRVVKPISGCKFKKIKETP